MKTAGAPTGSDVGDTIDYAFLVTNTGNVTLDPVAVDDPKVGTVTCPVTTLAPDASTTCTATYTLTQTDVDAGVVNNTATAYGNPPGGDPADTADDASATDSTSTPITAGPAITLDKVAGTPSGTSEGGTIGYTFLVTNTGNVTLDPVAVDDPKVGTVLCPVTTLAPDESTTCTATYTLTQTDVDAGVVNNTATAYGNPPGGDPADTADDASATDSTSTPIVQTPTIALDKSAGTPTGNDEGDTIDYTFLVTNTGNVTLDPVTVDDPKVGTVTCPVTTLAPDESTTCTATYTLTQTDVDAGVVNNTAIAYGNPPAGDPADTDDDASATDSTSTPITAGPAITLDKVAGTPSGTSEGGTIGYTFLVTNTGNVTLDTVAVDDPKVGTVLCPVTTLAPSEFTTCTATYALTQADVDAGVVNNTATAYGNPPGGDPADTADDASATDSTSTPIVQTPTIALDKSAGTPTGNDEGDTIDYTFLVTNTGNVTLDPVTVDDPKVGTVTCPVTTLAPDESTTCTATYTLTQTDVDAGVVNNTAIAYGNPPAGDPADTDDDASATDSTSTPITAGPAITLDKVAGTPSGTSEGGTIGYTFLVTNTGNVTLETVAVDDPKVGTVLCPVTTLAPSEFTTCTATYALTQADVDAGVVNNTATAYGNPPGGDPADTADDASATDSENTPIPANPSIALDKVRGHPDRKRRG